MSTNVDVIIVGAGPAGLVAALYASRRGLSTLVISQDIGGQAATTGTIENYPGVDTIDGLELMMHFKRQAETYGAKILLEEVTSVAKHDDEFSIQTHVGTYTSSAVILAQGLTHRHLNVPGEEKFIGRGVSYCATCDAPLFQGKRVVVVGGGNSAMDAALVLSKYASDVTIVTVNEEFRGERVLIDRMQAMPNITAITQGTMKSVDGEDAVSGVTYLHDDQTKSLPVDGVFVEIGYTVNPGLMKDVVALDGRNQIIVDPATNGTDVPGLFAAGDVTTIAQKQVVISAGEGAKAALAVDQYLQRLGRKPRSGITDWGVSAPLHHQAT